MADEQITTGVDDLLDLLNKVDKIAIPEAAQKLGVSTSFIQAWVDFLVEEQIIGIEYKFTTPIIYLNKPPQEKAINVKEDETLSLESYKNQFMQRAMQQKIPTQNLGFFWKNHMGDIINGKKDFFYREAHKRGLLNTDALWNEYKAKLLTS